VIKPVVQDKFPQVRLLGYRVNVFVIFLGTAKLPSTWVVPFCGPDINAKACLFPFNFTSTGNYYLPYSPSKLRDAQILRLPREVTKES